MRYTQPAVIPESFDFGKAKEDLRERFSRNIWMMGFSNSKGTDRYNYEVEFTYLLDELVRGPLYARGKRFEQLNALINSMINYGKGKKAPSQHAEAEVATA